MALAKAQYDLVARDKSQKAFASIRKNLGGLKGAIGGLGLAFGAAGFARFIQSSLDAGDEIQKLAIQTGASTEFLSEMRGVLELSGVSYGTFTKALTKGAKALGDAQAGLKTQSEAFSRLGLDIDQLAQLNPEELFFTIGTAIASIEDPTARSAAQAELLGAKSVELLRFFRQSPEAIATMRAEQVKFGNSLSRDMTDKMAASNDAMARLRQQFKGVGNAFALEFSDPIIEGSKVLSTLLIPVLRVVGNVFSILGTIIGAVGAAIAAVLSGEFREAFNIATLAVSDLKQEFSELLDFQEASANAPAPGSQAPALAAGGQKQMELSPQAERAIAAANAQALKETQEKQMKDPQLQQTNKTLKSIDKKLDNAGFAVAG